MNHMDIKGWFDAGVAKLYSHVVWKYPAGSTFVEVGVCFGKSAAYMVEQILLSQKEINFFAVDIWQSDSQFLTFQRNMVSCGYNQYIKPVRAPSAMAALQYPYESLDFVQIDADHKYNSVVEDIQVWLPRMKRGSILSGHDFHLDSVRKAVKDTLGFANVDVWDKCWVYHVK